MKRNTFSLDASHPTHPDHAAAMDEAIAWFQESYATDARRASREHPELPDDLHVALYRLAAAAATTRTDDLERQWQALLRRVRETGQ